MSKLTIEKLDYRWYQNILSILLGVYEKCTRRKMGLIVEKVLLEAERKTGLHNWGNDQFKLALTRLETLFNEDDSVPLGRFVAQSTCVQSACNRLALQDFLLRYPEIETTTVKQPVFILGLPRTGTSMLQEMMSQFPNRRALRFWEIVTPVPLLADSTEDVKRRRAIARMTKRAAYFMAPEQKSIHPLGVDTYEECWPLLFSSFAVVNHELAQGLPGWGDWLFNEWDMNYSYQEYSRFLKLFTWQDSKGLILKCPEHTWFIDELLQTFPDALILWTHRDPCTVIPSYSSLISLSQRTLRGTINPSQIGQQVLKSCAGGIQRALEHREDPRIHHIAYKDLVRDPKKCLTDIIEKMELLPEDVNIDKIITKMASSKLDTRTVHRYSREQWGVSKQEIEEHFKEYIDLFEDYLYD